MARATIQTICSWRKETIGGFHGSEPRKLIGNHKIITVVNHSKHVIALYNIFKPQQNNCSIAVQTINWSFTPFTEFEWHCPHKKYTSSNTNRYILAIFFTSFQFCCCCDCNVFEFESLVMSEFPFVLNNEWLYCMP